MPRNVGLDLAQPAFREWMEFAGRLVDSAIDGERLPGGYAAHFLASDLCARFIGAVQVTQILGD